MEKIKNNHDIPCSFRDPSGFLFRRRGTIYRQVNTAYREHYDHLMNSGLYEALINAELLISHKEVDVEAWESDSSYKIIEPEKVLFISYPHEWCFTQLKDAALATLKIQKKALEFAGSDRGIYLKQLEKFEKSVQ